MLVDFSQVDVAASLLDVAMETRVEIWVERNEVHKGSRSAGLEDEHSKDSV